jgi:2-polyprenyl-3-methyl-5-hydroxy-6-metoxy-1,4-benzoquinol methylase
MEPLVTGNKYNKIAEWWNKRHFNSSYGVPQIEKALGYRAAGGTALDVGCGSGGRYIRILQEKGYSIVGLDVSEEMIKLATTNHPKEKFFHHDVSTWESIEKFDFIVAWDSLFHLPYTLQRNTLTKICSLLAKGGVLIYTFGNGDGEHTDVWHDEEFSYSSIGINNNAQTLIESGLTIMHLELDQYPEKHVYTIAKKP